MTADVRDATDVRPDMFELTPYSTGPTLIEARLEGARLCLAWQDGSRTAFPLVWLRDHCACTDCRHPQIRERLHVPLDPTPAAARADIVEGQLWLEWQDGHQSHYASGWLHQRRPGKRETITLPQRLPWRDGFRPERIRHADFIASRQGERAWITALLRDGLVLLDEGPLADEEVSRLAQRIGPLRSTNFGARFDVRSKPNPNNAAFTPIGLALHTDLPNWRQPPDIQLLYCLENGASGGESLFADGLQVAETLREQSPEAFRRLSETPIDFRFQDEEQDIGLTAPILGCDSNGNVVEVRFNNWIRDTLRLPEQEIAPWYAAYRHFWQLLHDPRHQIEFSLAPGQMVAFDNRRVLHGRRAFDPNTGSRHLQGTYLDRDMLESRLRVLARHS
ncbi:TauD/TfdA family dioxygenase [Billgrantia sp. LNSP4103-1]|uniref:TauD/TfdA family dioxygenase n=1 Tax=Billgrantia sp. LNSP4103-1 TaxID=3410266 RepID=UPI00403F350E